MLATGDPGSALARPVVASGARTPDRRTCCTGLAGEAFFTLADGARAELEPRLRAEIGPDVMTEWGTSHHPGMIDIAAILAAPLPWDDRAARQQIAWMLRVGAVWWDYFASLVEGAEVEHPPAAKQGRRASITTKRATA